MSDYVREKVIRYPIEEEMLEAYNANDLEELIEILEDKSPEFKSSPEKGFFTIEYSDNYIGYLDYILNYEYGACEGDFGISRELNNILQLKWNLIFSRFVPNIDSSKFRLVRFCYYNGVDCPEYYDVTPETTDDEEW